MDRDTKIQTFVSLTNTTATFARSFLESNAWNVDGAVNAFFQEGSSSSIAPEEKDIPPPQAQVTEQLFQPYVPRQRGRMRRQQQVEPWKEHPRLAALYKKPQYTYKGSFSDAVDTAATQGKWLLVNIQDDAEFKCHSLNRDVFAKKGMEAFITKSFVFWQQPRQTEDAKWYINFYSVRQVPHLAILDPRSRNTIKNWSVDEIFNSFYKDAREFAGMLDVGGPARKKQKIKLTDEEMMKQAIAESLLDSTSSSEALTTATVPTIDSAIDLTQEAEKKEGKPKIEPTQIPEPKRQPQTVKEPFPSEPPAGDDVTTLQIRLPGGGKPLKRRFRKADEVESVYEFVCGKMNSDGAGVKNTSKLVLKLTYPRRTITERKSTLKDAKLLNTVVLVELVD